MSKGAITRALKPLQKVGMDRKGHMRDQFDQLNPWEVNSIRVGDRPAHPIRVTKLSQLARVLVASVEKDKPGEYMRSLSLQNGGCLQVDFYDFEYQMYDFGLNQKEITDT